MGEKRDILFLSERQVEAMGGFDMEKVMADVEEVMSLFNKGDHISPYKVVMRKNDDPAEEMISGNMNAMPGYIGGSFNMAGIKWIGQNPHNVEIGLPRAMGLVILNDPVTKLPLAIMDGTKISAKRTGAVSGVAAKYLARKDAKEVAIVGAGVQGRTQLEAIMVARPDIKTVHVYDLYPSASHTFSEEMHEKLKVQVIPAEGLPGLEAACRRSDIIVTASLGKIPIVQAPWLKEGVLCVCISGNEFTQEAAGRCDKIVVDTWQGIKHRSPEEIVTRFPARVLENDAVDAELGEVINKTKPGRVNESERFFFNSVGMGIEDVAVAARVYRSALKAGVGAKMAYLGD